MCRLHWNTSWLFWFWNSIDERVLFIWNTRSSPTLRICHQMIPKLFWMLYIFHRRFLIAKARLLLSVLVPFFLSRFFFLRLYAEEPASLTCFKSGHFKFSLFKWLRRMVLIFLPIINSAGVGGGVGRYWCPTVYY